MSDITYSPDMCERIIVILSDGDSLKQVAQLLGVDMETIIEWRIHYPMFDGAIEAGLIFAEERMNK
jgi:hypothetical protein